jgi:hypothetical protein
MPTACGKLTDSFLIDCTKKPVGGVESTMYQIDKGDWNDATLTFDATNPFIVTGITLKSGAQARQWQVFKKGHKPKFETQDGDYGATYKHSISTNIPIYTDAVKQQIPGLTEGYGVYIVENVQKSGVVFEIYGASNGLRMPDLARDLAANEGVITGTLTNDEDMNEPNPPLTFKTTTGTYAATKAALIALLTPAT